MSQGSGSLLANGLRLLGSGAFSLNQASNNINVLVADLTGAATTLSYRDANGFSIGTGAGGLSTVKTAGGGVGSDLGITVGTAGTAANTLTLNAYGAVTQATAADNVTAGGLQLLGNGPYTLNNAGNDVTTLCRKCGRKCQLSRRQWFHGRRRRRRAVRRQHHGHHDDRRRQRDPG